MLYTAYIYILLNTGYIFAIAYIHTFAMYTYVLSIHIYIYICIENIYLANIYDICTYICMLNNQSYSKSVGMLGYEHNYMNLQSIPYIYHMTKLTHPQSMTEWGVRIEKAMEASGRIILV